MTEALNQIGVFIMQNNKINEIVNLLKDCLEALKKSESCQMEFELVIKYSMKVKDDEKEITLDI